MPASAEIFRQFLNKTFIETGTCAGDGVQAALDAGFALVLSVELSEELYRHCCQRFFSEVAPYRADQSVQLCHGHSVPFLENILSAELQIHPCTFWLDAHHSGGNTARSDDDPPTWNELKTIAKYKPPGCTVLIDDVVGWDDEALCAALREINPDFRFSWHDGRIFDGQQWGAVARSILAAQP